MAKNNHFSNLDALLREQAAETATDGASAIYSCAAAMATVENVIAVVSDLTAGTSRIFAGAFADVLGIDGYSKENSIWERRILSLMPEEEQEAKFIAELRFFHHLRRLGRQRRNYFLMSKLRFTGRDGNPVNVLHRMYYILGTDGETVSHAVCLYGPLTTDFQGKSVAVNSLTGVSKELTATSDSNILSPRERQILALINSGLKSREIADRLHISVHTVSRHRQEILAKLQVKNSIEACRLAASMNMI